ncbi:MAG: SRPBCC family protein, partial [Anaerolineae bacterium]|nr:SRPBCC family protein [Anaerolineae bacterium]
MPKFEREVEIDAPVEKVWEVMTNPTYWPQWFPGIESVSGMTSVREGGSFEWTDEGRTGRGIV